MFRNLMPYSDVHELNLDWIIKKVKELGIDVDDLNDIVNNKIDVYVRQYIEENLSSFLLGAMYDEENTCITLQQVEVLIDSDHVYNRQREEVLVLEGR